MSQRKLCVSRLWEIYWKQFVAMLEAAGRVATLDTDLSLSRFQFLKVMKKGVKMRSNLVVATLMSVLCTGQALADGLADRLEGVQSAPLGNADMELVQARYIRDNLADMLASLPQAVQTPWSSSLPFLVLINSTDNFGNSLILSPAQATFVIHSADQSVFDSLNQSLDQIVQPIVW